MQGCSRVAARRAHGAQPAATNQLLFGIIQGGTFDDLRRASAQAIVELDFDGYAIGGVSVGEPEEEMMRAVESAEPFLPADRPRYAMGLGTPPQMLEMVARGMDMFDCVLPTRLARNGTAFTAAGTLNLKNAEFALDKRPIEENCACPACREFTRGYIRHLIKAEEILGLRLITLHNLHFYLNLMTDLLWAVTHLAEELHARGDFDHLPATDRAHLVVDVKRAYTAARRAVDRLPAAPADAVPVPLLARGAAPTRSTREASVTVTE